MSRNRFRGREVHGILILDKPKGLTSNAALQRVKQLYAARKAGHTGSLDPLATGLLPICFGEATKFSQFLLTADKTYQVTAQLGIQTTTGDAEGDVVASKSVPVFTVEQVETVLNKFRGEIEQVPSMYSALKHNGKPLYEYARQGIEIEREARTIHVYHMAIQELTSNSLSLLVSCSKGTYIRTLVEDIGQMLGCGAHVSMLRRTDVGDYQSPQMHTLEQLTQLADEQRYAELNDLLIPIETAVSHLPRIDLSSQTAFHFKNGQSVFVPKAPSVGFVALFLETGDFLGVGEVADDGKIIPRKLLQHKKERQSTEAALEVE